MPLESIRSFLESAAHKCGPIYNERSLQLELGMSLRLSGYRVEFERPMSVQSLAGSTKKPKRNLDLLVSDGQRRIAIELKVPLAGRVPETMYDFCADIEFVEAIVRIEMATQGVCLLMTSDRLFWSGSATDQIYRFFREPGAQLGGTINKPTGDKGTMLKLSGSYGVGWANVTNAGLMGNARYLLIEITSHRQL